MLVARVIWTLLLGSLAWSAGNEAVLDAPQQARYQKLCESLIAPCCWSETLAMHRSPASLQARDEVAALIVAGKSDREILDEFVARYGARILVEPEGRRGQWLYLIPVLALLVAVFFAVRFLRRRTLPSTGSGPPPGRMDDSEWDW
jgi:cytochrome c-type biogenesis protein CcmH